MKEKIERLAKGIFDYKLPNLILSDEKIEVTIEEGKNYSGSFVIKNDENTIVKGIIYSSNEHFRIKNNNFFGKENKIEYECMVQYQNAGETIKGKLSIITNCGEMELPFECNIELPYCNTSLGKIKDLYQFANLAKADWTEALKIFKSEEFERVFLYHDKRNQLLYQSLKKSRSISHSMEEFLISIHKKLKINITVNKTALNLNLQNESIMEQIKISKDNWGYEEIRISTDADFIELDHKIIWTDNFMGSNYNLDVLLNPTGMRNGNNYGRIYLKTVHQTIEITIFCHCTKEHVEKNPSYGKVKLYQKKLMNNYLDFRKNAIEAKQYISDTMDVIQNLQILDKDNFIYELIKTHITIISGNMETAKEELFYFAEKAEERRSSNELNQVFFYCGYLYLNALYKKDETVITDAIKVISDYYKNGYHTFPMLWFLFYLDKKFDQNKSLKYQELKDQFYAGCHSPMLYYEAFAVIRDEPNLLLELGAFEIQLVNWMTKNVVIPKDVAIQYTFLANREKRFQPVIYQCLVKLYEENKSIDLLSAICSMLIKGHKNARKYFKWYELGVKEQIRITELYEYYMYTFDETQNAMFEQPILYYFMYHSNLNDKKKAYLFSTIIQNKDQNQETYQLYEKQMKQFGLRQLKLRNISNSLAIIYDHLFRTEEITKDYAKDLCELMFQHEIHCTNSNMKGVYIVHKELEDEIYIPLIDGQAGFPIFTENAQIFLVDMFDNRYLTTIDYTLNKLMHHETMIKKCMEFNPNQTMFLLHSIEEIGRLNKEDETLLEIRKNILMIPNLREDYKRTILLYLFYYYFDHYEDERAFVYLKQLSFDTITGKDRTKMIEYIIKQSLYKEAYEALKQYSYDGIDIKYLKTLCTEYIHEFQKESNLTKESISFIFFTFTVFLAGACDDVITEYLVKNYSGTTNDMIFLLQNTKDAKYDLTELEERILGQVLFTENYEVDSFAVFESYYNKKGNHDLIRAYMSYFSYQYLFHDIALSDNFFQILKNEVTYEENETGMLALIKYYSRKKECSEEEKEFIYFHINRLIENNIVLPYFKEFKNKISLPDTITNKYFVEYKANPKGTVTIHYRMKVDNKFLDEEFDSVYKTECMKNVCHGIFVYEFVLFYNETLEYYITEKLGEEEIQTEVNQVKLSDQFEGSDQTKYDQINFMLLAKEVEDNKTLMELMEQYIQSDYLSSEMFKPI